MAVTELPILPQSGDAYVDVRDGGRSLRVTWHALEHASDDFFVLSIWRERTCIATVRLDRTSAAQLIGTLVEGLAATAK